MFVCNEEQRAKAKCMAIALLVFSIIGSNLWGILLASFILVGIHGDKAKWEGWSKAVLIFFVISLLGCVLMAVLYIILAIVMFASDVNIAPNIPKFVNTIYGVSFIIATIFSIIQFILSIRAYSAFKFIYVEGTAAAYLAQPLATPVVPVGPAPASTTAPPQTAYPQLPGTGATAYKPLPP